MASKLDQLRMMSDVVANTWDIEAIRRLHPQDATPTQAVAQSGRLTTSR